VPKLEGLTIVISDVKLAQLLRALAEGIEVSPDVLVHDLLKSGIDQALEHARNLKRKEAKPS